ncbi:MAG TPA: hypothetical protein PLT47_03650 [Bacteroidales bacterium]|nr:hypothetical protein [Bacteroidales bacterium]
MPVFVLQLPILDPHESILDQHKCILDPHESILDQHKCILDRFEVILLM